MSHFARIKQVLQAAREDQATIGGEWSSDDRIDLGPDAEPMEPDTWGEWADMPVRLAPEAPTTRSGPTRRSILGGMLAVLGIGSATVALVATRSPIMDAYRRMEKGNDDFLRACEMPETEGITPATLAKERAMDEASDRANMANLELVNLIARAQGVSLTGFTDEQEEQAHRPVAIHREGNKLFLLAIATPGTFGTCGCNLVGRSRFVRPVVIDLADLPLGVRA